jgi:hypothetical protein
LSLPSEKVTVSGTSNTTINLASTTTAVYIGGILGAGDRYNLRIILTPDGNRSGDVYFNDATAVTSGSAAILAPQVAAVAVYRTVSGLAWEDRNGEGVALAGADGNSYDNPTLSGADGNAHDYPLAYAGADGNSHNYLPGKPAASAASAGRRRPVGLS